MEDYGISYDDSLMEFDEYFENSKNINQNIEKEIESINNLHEKITKEITSYFEELHHQLNEREEKLKYELDLKITDIKDELEKYFQESNNILLSYERLSKAIKKYENKNNCEIKTLCYISEINKINSEAKNLLKKPIKNLDISFQDNKCLVYKEYYFNGIPIPKNINYYEIKNEIMIFWDIGDLRMKDLDSKNIKYSLKLKDETKNYNYEVNETKILLTEIRQNINYEVKVRALINGSYGDWSEAIKFKFEPNKENIFGKGFFGNTNNNQEGGIFGNKNNNEGNPLFGNINNNQEGGLFGNKNNNKGNPLFGYINNNQEGGLFENNEKYEGRSIFGIDPKQ